MPVEIHPSAIVEPGAELGDGVRIGPFCHIGAHAVIGDRTQLHAHAVVTGHTTLGHDCAVHSHAVLGGTPQVLGFQDVPESRLEIGNDCTMREHTTVHAGVPKLAGVTRLGNKCFMMVGSHVAHDCQLGNDIVIANGVQIGGHVEIGDNVWFGGLVAVHQFTRIGRNAFIGGGAILVEDVIPFGSVIGNRAKLAGLNMVGLKRRGYDKAQLHEIRSAYKAVFAGGGLFKDRLADAAIAFKDKPLAMEIINFVLAAGGRPICKPG
ncbi:acyl-ACP--UDP-N-acetylglucosamine O-acyltransferase [Hyphomonas sp.]|jgi:UDP-N-acetylglucosamine acyltransferase|uniref:acyl-ACP--UDP-N-acetylglucosamine O-acyltransferase n=1 Tax=Hyphomonas sp. TaxID=87 RepID=UPI0039E52F6C